MKLKGLCDGGTRHQFFLFLNLHNQNFLYR
jgi:hypothetical protein